MTKNELKTGMIVECRNGNQYFVMLNPEKAGHELIRFKGKFKGGYIPLKSYEDDLKFKDQTWQEFDIMKIYSAGKTICNIFNIGDASPSLILNLKWKRQESQKSILNESEKQYLKAVLSPFKSRIGYICKYEYGPNSEYIYCKYNDSPYMLTLPIFKKGSMYKEMETNRNYRLEELKLFD